MEAHRRLRASGHHAGRDVPRGLINTRVLVVAGACLFTLLGSFALSRPDSAAENTRVAPLPPARVVDSVEPTPVPELGEAPKLPALRREARPRKPRRTPAPVVVDPAPDEFTESDEFAEPEPEPVVPAPVPVAPAPVAPAPVAPSPPVNPAPAPEPEPPPVYLDDSG